MTSIGLNMRLCEVASRVEEFSGNPENSDLLASNLGNRSATRFPLNSCYTPRAEGESAMWSELKAKKSRKNRIIIVNYY